MIPTNNGRDDIDTWPGTKAKMKFKDAGRLEPPDLGRDIDLDRAFLAGMESGWRLAAKGDVERYRYRKSRLERLIREGESDD